MLFHPSIINPNDYTRKKFEYPTSKLVCVGRNYIEHAKELDNPIPSEPLLFVKTSNTLVDFENTISIPSNRGECHHEVEIALLIGEELSKVDEKTGIKAIEGVGIGLDLTLRELQLKLKNKGHPWERAKNFDGSAPISAFLPASIFDFDGKEHNIDVELLVNNESVQAGHSKDMIFSIGKLISEISACFTLYPGDIILTGTPKGVAALNDSDVLQVKLNGEMLATASVKIRTESFSV